MLNKILLVNLDGTRSSGMEEIGVGYLASFLRSKGFTVKIIGGVEEKLDYEDIVKYAPDVIGVTLYKVNKAQSYCFCKKIKEHRPDVYIIAGGYMATYHDIEILQENDQINAIIRREGEHTFYNLLEALNKNKPLSEVKGITYKEDNLIHSTEDAAYIKDLNELPFPARDILIENNLKIAMVSTSRGCMSNCSFCIAKSYWGKWRGRDIDNIIKELKYLNKLGIHNVNFADTSFEDPDYRCERMKAIAEAIIEHGVQLNYFVDVRAEFYKKCSDELIALLKKSGLVMVLIGIECGNEWDMKVYGKRAKLEDNGNAILFFRKYDIWVNPGFINFNPYSSFEGLMKNVRFLRDYGYAYDILKFTTKYQLAKGSFLYNRIIEDGLMLEGGYDELYKYKYKNPGVGELINYFTQKLEELNDKADYVFNYFGQMTYYILSLKVMKRFFENNTQCGSKEEAIGKINTQFSDILEILNRVTDIHADYMEKIIELASSGWDESKAEKIAEVFLPLEVIIGYRQKLNRNKTKFYRDMIKNFKEQRESIDEIFYNVITM